jgi:hypothetical protein
MRLEDLKPGASVRGLVAGAVAKIVQADVNREPVGGGDVRGRGRKGDYFPKTEIARAA